MPRIITLLLSLILAGMMSQQAFAVGAPNPEKKLYYPTYPKINYKSGAGTKAQIQRGEYLAKAGDCIACHTNSAKPNSPQFGGGTYIYTPFGMLFGPNISSDKEYGVGNWTDKQFIRTMRQGIRPNGSYAYPVFPFMHFNHVGDQDLKDIFAYLKSIPAIHQPSPENKMMFPFNWRFLQLGWRVMFFNFSSRQGIYKDDPAHTKEWNRGAYLVQGLGHCGMCHTPLNMLGSEKYQYYLTGGNFIDGFYAPDITSQGLKKYTVPQVVDILRKGHNNVGGKVGGPMLEVVKDSTSYMTNKDLTAIAVYLKSVKSKHPEVSSGKIGPDTGKKLYNTTCASCHNSGGAGAPRIGNKQDWAPFLSQGIQTVYTHAIDGIGSMPAKGTCMTCSDDEIKAAVDYIVKMTKEGGIKGPKPTTGSPVKLSLKEGADVYDRACASCHTKGLNGAPKLGDKKAWSPIIQQNMDVVMFNVLNGNAKLKMEAKHGCQRCTNTELMAATRYMVDKGKTQKNEHYNLW
tara:strand:+ start:66370 stop:67908 length:1539 start_codon:yes stop_codon:yes gene_type:complete